MGRLNLDPLMTFPDGSHLVVSTQCLKEGDFSCALYRALMGAEDGASFQIISNHLAATTCLSAQEHAYSYALRLYPSAGAELRKPPYLIWQGPRSMVLQ
jgi:hypothetical protein